MRNIGSPYQSRIVRKLRSGDRRVDLQMRHPERRPTRVTDTASDHEEIGIEGLGHVTEIRRDASRELSPCELFLFPRLVRRKVLGEAVLRVKMAELTVRDKSSV